MRRLFLLSMALCAVAGPMQAAGRFNCAVDDENIRLTVDTGFAAGPGQRLNHFRGALIGKSTAIPEDFRRLMLDSSDLTQTWGYGNDLRLSMIASNGNGDGASIGGLVMVASGQDETAPLLGSYTLTITTPGGSPQSLTGPLSCSAK